MPASGNGRVASVAIIGEFFIDEVFTEFNAFPKPGEECFARKFERKWEEEPRLPPADSPSSVYRSLFSVQLENPTAAGSLIVSRHWA